ncbi:unnamed protein product [Lymnaea stagnalis]|uniref:Phosphonoacetaldehyde hydrolase n=1 Tax=Lymnaea stagnalis TaxID=6523 RepID=A0AAV2HQA0_LYMST
MSLVFKHSRSYVGPVKACILDWSGTTIDKFVLAPAIVFVETFKKHKLTISMAEARVPMGIRKDLHIKAITELPEVRQRWKDVHGRYPDQRDVDALYKDLVPMQLGVLLQYSDLIPGTAETVKVLRNELGLKIGVTTGFTRSMVDVLLPEAKRQGFEPDANVAGDDVIHGTRPKPFMLYKNLDMLDVPNIQSVVKVDDTMTGVEEALAAGCWGVGLARYSNNMNINSLEEEQRMSAGELQLRLERSRDLLAKAGAHYVIDTIEELPGVVAHINSRLAKGEKP